MIPTADDFRKKLNEIIEEVKIKNLPYIDVWSKDVHRQVGGYPGSNHRMPVCCDVMKENMQDGDLILQEPPSGMGANVLIRYFLDNPQGKILREMGKKGISEEEFQAEMKLESSKEYKTREWNKYAFGSKKLENLILGVLPGIAIAAAIILVLF